MMGSPYRRGSAVGGAGGTSHTATQASLGPGRGAEGRGGPLGAVPDDLAARQSICLRSATMDGCAECGWGAPYHGGRPGDRLHRLKLEFCQVVFL